MRERRVVFHQHPPMSFRHRLPVGCHSSQHPVSPQLQGTKRTDEIVFVVARAASRVRPPLQQPTPELQMSPQRRVCPQALADGAEQALMSARSASRRSGRADPAASGNLRRARSVRKRARLCRDRHEPRHDHEDRCKPMDYRISKARCSGRGGLLNHIVTSAEAPAQGSLDA